MPDYWILTNDFYLHKRKIIPKGTIVKEYPGHAFGISSHNDIAIQVFIKEEQKSLLFSDSFYVIKKDILKPYQFIFKEEKKTKKSICRRFCNKLYKYFVKIF